VAAARDIEQLYEKHAGELLAYLSKRCPVDAARDLLHETFLQVLRHGRLSDVTRPRAWLFGIARHTLARHYREQPIGSLDDALSNHAGNMHAADSRVATMREAIGRLSPELREPLELRLDQELSYEEIANVLDIPLGTVRSRLHTAVRRLREALKTE
jgi:RNA polymerase sigma-70 factor (ECF subfamily)